MLEKLLVSNAGTLPTFTHGSLNHCDQATDCVVVIDVLRAFTTAAYAFAGGAKTIYCVAEIDQALALKNQYPDSLVMGEVNGYSIPEFDLNNSPDKLIKTNLHGKTLIQRTTAGTQGLIQSVNGKTILAASLVTAKATAAYIQKIQPNAVHFVETGIQPDGRGEEDTACANYIEGLLTGNFISEESTIQKVRHSINGKRFTENSSPDLPAVDLDWVCAINRFNWILIARRINETMVQLHKKEK